MWATHLATFARRGGGVLMASWTLTWPIAMIAAGAVALLWKRYNPIKGNPGTIAAVALIAFGLVLGGYMANPFGTTTTTTQNVVPGQVTAVTLSAPAVYNSTAIAINSANNHQIDVTATDATIPATGYDVNVTVTMSRSGSAGALLVPVSCTSDNFQNPSNPSDAGLYNIVDKDNSGKLNVFVGGVQAQNSIGFTEGSASASTVIYFDMSLAGRQKTNQYDSRFVNCDVGGDPVIFKVTHLSAAS